VVLSPIRHVCLLIPNQTPFLTDIGLLDPRYVLLPPQRPPSTIPQSVQNKIAIHFATRFSQNVNTVRQYLKQENITQWARVQQLEGGDLMYASELFDQAEDRRDATYVRVCINSDICLWFKFTRKFFSVWPTCRPQSAPSPRCSGLGGEAFLWPAKTYPRCQVTSCTWTGCRRWHIACRDNLLARLYSYVRCRQEKFTRNGNLFDDGSNGGGGFGSTWVLGGEGEKWGLYSHYWSHGRVAGCDLCTRWLSAITSQLPVTK
jgi:hypothetical protein